MRVPRILRSPFEFMKELAKEFALDRSSLVAAAVSYYVFLSLIPLLLLAVAAFGFILRGEEDAYSTVINFLSTYSPEGAGGVAPLIQEIIQGSSAATGFGLIALLWAGSQAFVNLEIAVNIAWDVEPRSFIKQRLIAIVLLFAVGLLLLLSFGITTAISAARGYDFFGLDIPGWIWTLLAYPLPLLISIAMFTIVFKLLPNTQVPFAAAFVGGMITGVLWELAKIGFSWYVTNFANFSAVYGSLASVILLLVWIYYSSVVTILGAQISALYNVRVVNPARRQVS